MGAFVSRVRRKKTKGGKRGDSELFETPSIIVGPEDTIPEAEDLGMLQKVGSSARQSRISSRHSIVSRRSRKSVVPAASGPHLSQSDEQFGPSPREGSVRSVPSSYTASDARGSTIYAKTVYSARSPRTTQYAIGQIVEEPPTLVRRSSSRKSRRSHQPMPPVPVPGLELSGVPVPLPTQDSPSSHPQEAVAPSKADPKSGLRRRGTDVTKPSPSLMSRLKKTNTWHNPAERPLPPLPKDATPRNSMAKDVNEVLVPHDHHHLAPDIGSAIMSPPREYTSGPEVDDLGVLSETKSILANILSPLASKKVSPRSVHVDETFDLPRGSYGKVRRARLDGYSAPVAVKELRPAGSAKQRSRVEIAFARELRVWSDLDHPNILPLVAFRISPEEGVSWFISPFMTEGNALEYLDRTNPDMLARLQLATDSIAGLSYLHERNVYHGDMRGANVLICIIEDKARALLCDFGLAKVKEAHPSAFSTSSFSQKGSSRYISPELCSTPIRGTQSDIWAWGCVLLEITTDFVPYEETRDDRLVLSQVVAGVPPARADHLPVSIDVQYLLKCCWGRAAERPTAQECHEILEDIMQSFAAYDETQYMKDSRKRIAKMRTARYAKRSEADGAEAETAPGAVAVPDSRAHRTSVREGRTHPPTAMRSNSTRSRR